MDLKHVLRTEQLSEHDKAFKLLGRDIIFWVHPDVIMKFINNTNHIISDRRANDLLYRNILIVLTIIHIIKRVAPVDILSFESIVRQMFRSIRTVWRIPIKAPIWIFYISNALLSSNITWWNRSRVQHSWMWGGAPQVRL